MQLERYFSQLAGLCTKKKITFKSIGNTGEDDNVPIYAVEFIADPTQPVLCICAGVHGDETAPSLAVLDFLKTTDTNAINSNTIFLPLVNPTGFSVGTRANYRGNDINRGFSKPRLMHENKLVYDYLKALRIGFICSLHEDLDEQEFYLYNFETKPQRIYRQIRDMAKKSFRIKDGPVEGEEGHFCRAGLITNLPTDDGSIEYRLWSEGAPYALCTETPGKASLTTRISLNKEIIRKLISYNSAIRK